MQKPTAIETLQMQMLAAVLLVPVLIYKFARACGNAADVALLHELRRLAIECALSFAVGGQLRTDLLNGESSVGVAFKKAEKLGSFFGVVGHFTSKNESNSQILYIIQHFLRNVNRFFKINVKK